MCSERSPRQVGLLLVIERNARSVLNCFILDDTHFFFIPGLPQQHVVKLRPGLDNFLKEASAMYDLFIYTHGTRLYAEQIAKIIDPDDSYFHHRIVARTDTPDMVHKSLKLLFPSCDDSMIMVLDDRIDVWKVSSIVQSILISCS